MVGAVKVGLMILLIAAAASAAVEARFDFVNDFGLLLSKANSRHAGGDACCDDCICTLSDPPQCQCFDWKETCYEGCNSCICRRIWPPQCRCFDTNDFCYPPCKTASSKVAELPNQN